MFKGYYKYIFHLQILLKKLSICVLRLAVKIKKPTSEDYEVTFDYSFLVEDDDG